MMGGGGWLGHHVVDGLLGDLLHILSVTTVGVGLVNKRLGGLELRFRCETVFPATL